MLFFFLVTFFSKDILTKNNNKGWSFETMFWKIPNFSKFCTPRISSKWTVCMHFQLHIYRFNFNLFWSSVSTSFNQRSNKILFESLFRYLCDETSSHYHFSGLFWYFYVFHGARPDERGGDLQHRGPCLHTQWVLGVERSCLILTLCHYICYSCSSFRQVRQTCLLVTY